MAKQYRTRDHHAGARRIPAILAALIATPMVAFATPGCDEPIEDDDAPFGDADAAGDEEPVTKRDTLVDPTNGTSVNVGAKQWKQYTFTKTAGWRYTVCVESTDGDVDLYGHYAGPPSTTSYQYGSINTPSDTKGRHDCIAFTATSGGTYYIGVYGFDNDVSTFRYNRSSSNNNVVPSYLQGQLKRPNGCTTPAIAKYSPFNSPWGNPSYDPFYEGTNNYIHNGVDFACAPGTTVRAVCGGTVTTGQLSGSWGYYAKQECSFGGNKVTIAYDHLQASGLATSGVYVAAGGTIGKIVDLTLSGEPDHLHLGICTSSLANCSSLQSGAHKLAAGMPANYISAEASGLWAP